MPSCRMFFAALLTALAFNAAAESVTVVAEDDWYPYCADRGGKPEVLP